MARVERFEPGKINTGRFKFGPIPVASVGDGEVRPTRVRGQVKLWSAESNLTVTAEHYARPKVLRERAGGWRVVERQGQLAATTWDGHQPLRVQLKLIFDGVTGLDNPVPVTQPVNALRVMGYRVAELDRPPRLHVVGAIPYATGVLLSHKTTPTAWVLEELDIEDVISMPSGDPCQVIATVTLLEHVITTFKTETLRSTGVKKYRWKRGDTISSVARTQLGDERRAEWIRDANPALTKKGWSKVEPGTEVKIPKRIR